MCEERPPWGKVKIRFDRPERKALYDSAGRLHCSFAQDATDDEIRSALATQWLWVDDEATVWPV